MVSGTRKSWCVCFLMVWGFLLWAQDEPMTLPLWDDEQEEPVKEKFRFKNRMIELSLLNMNINLSNDFIKTSDFLKDPVSLIQSNGDIWKNPIVVNIDDFLDGFKFDFGAVIKPVSLNFNWKDEWGVGLDIGRVDAVGNAALSGTLLGLKETSTERFGVGGAVFADVGIPVFFHYNNFKIKIRPAAYVPLVYTEPGVTYTYRESVNPDTGAEGLRLEVDYDVRVYSIVDMRGADFGDVGVMGQRLLDNVWDIAGNNLGYDFGLCVEYLWDYWLDIGIDIVNIPVPYAASKLHHYAQLNGEVFFDSSAIDIADVIESGTLPDDAYGYSDDIQFKYGNNTSGKTIYRPFKTLVYANYRPFAGQVFAIMPSIGFSINHLYTQPAAVEGGLSFRWDLANIFIPTLGINYQDRKWKNSIDLVLNLRAFELDIGLSFQSTDFIKSFQGAGLGISTGVKLGW